MKTDFILGLMTLIMSDDGVCRTAPATLGLLIIVICEILKYSIECPQHNLNFLSFCSISCNTAAKKPNK